MEVDDEIEKQEWIRICQLISDLGVTKRSLVEEEKMPDNFGTLKNATERLLKSLDKQATESRKSLDRIAKQKWASKLCVFTSFQKKTLFFSSFFLFLLTYFVAS